MKQLTRREVLNAGMAAGATATLAAALDSPARAAPPPDPAAAAAASYPPARLGLRGQDDASLSVAHAMRDGQTFGEGVDTGEAYDLIVIGAGASGLAAAYFFRQRFPAARVLILDNCDDFGGHARRNEFTVDGRQVLNAGGSFTILFPESFTPAGKALLADIGIDQPSYYAALKDKAARSPASRFAQAAFFDRETYGVDRLVTSYPGAYDRDPGDGDQHAAWADFLRRAPLSAQSRRELYRLAVDRTDYLAGMSLGEKTRRLHSICFADYLADIAKVSPETVRFLHNEQGFHFNVGAGADSFSAWFAHTAQAIGFQGLGLPPVSFRAAGTKIHLPDGNAAVMRLLVRALIPDALPGSVGTVVAQRLDYGQLDRDGAPVRLRLDSTVVHAAHIGDMAHADEVAVTYVTAGETRKVRGAVCVAACFNAVIPYICPELPDAQKQALHTAVRKPLLITAVALRRWEPFARAGASFILSSTSFYQMTTMETGLTIGGYRASESPGEPAVISLYRYPENPGSPARDQYRAGRAEMLSTDWQDYEGKAISQLTRMLAGTGFDARRDVAGVMVNRWAHGYACGSNELYDPAWANEAVPWLQGRKRFGRIAIANSDAAGVSMMQAAFDQADRAVGELVQDVIRPTFYNLNPERG